MAYTYNITSKGQVTIPKFVRDQLGLHPGGRATFRIKKGGEVVVERPKTIDDIRKALHASRGKGEPLTENEKLIGTYLAKKHGVR